MKLPIHANFKGVWVIFSQNDVICCSNPQKAPPCMETRRLSHNSVKIGPTVRSGCVPEKKKDRTEQSKKSQRRHISPTWGEAPTKPICTEICTVVTVPDVITCANFWSEIFRVTVLQGSNFLLSQWFLHGPYNSAARNSVKTTPIFLDRYRDITTCLWTGSIRDRKWPWAVLQLEYNSKIVSPAWLPIIIISFAGDICCISRDIGSYNVSCSWCDLFKGHLRSAAVTQFDRSHMIF